MPLTDKTEQMSENSPLPAKNKELERRSSDKHRSMLLPDNTKKIIKEVYDSSIHIIFLIDANISLINIIVIMFRVGEISSLELLSQKCGSGFLQTQTISHHKGL